MTAYTYIFWGLTFNDVEVNDASWDACEGNDQQSELGIIEGYFCSEGFAHPYVAITESLSQAQVGVPARVVSQEIKPDWEARLKEYCRIIGIPWSKPQWWLTAYHE